MKKPFDLEAAKRGEPLITRDGDKARFVAHVPEACAECRLICFIQDHSSVAQYYENGLYYDSGSECGADLFMDVDVDVPELKKVTLYSALCRDPDGVYFLSTTLFTDEAPAREGFDSDFVRLLTEYPVEVEVSE